jgi:hypothetical protein
MKNLRIILAAALLALAPAAFAAQPVGVPQLGASFSNVSPGAGGSTTMLAAASNTKGCWLRTAVVLNGTSAVAISLFTDTAAPTGNFDATKRLVLAVQGTATAPLANALPYPLWLPAGVGISAFASAAGGFAGATWDCPT